MLCRALIAAIALTCTLSRIHAYAQVTQRLDRIKDLVCVFLLSGMQKEDLDVNMLTKLQRHNVNINAMNNQELLRECTKSRYNRSNDEITNLTETPPTFATKNKNDFNTNPILRSLNGPLNVETESVYNASSIYKNSPVLTENENRTSMKYIDDNKSNVDKVIIYDEDQAKLQNVLSFWNNMRLKQIVKDTESIQNLIYKNEQENRRSVTENLHSTENDALSRLLVNVLTKSKAVTIKPATTQRPINIGDLYAKLYSLQIRDVGKKPDSVELRKKILLDKEHIGKESGTKREESNLRDPYFESLQKSERVESTSYKELKHSISQDIIKEIAESVKEIILRDLRMEMFQTTTVRTTTTTIVSSTAIQSTLKIESIVAAISNKENKKAESIMNKFLELFEEIKSLNQNMIITNKNKIETNNKIIRQNYDIEELKVYPQVTVPTRTLPFYNVNQAYGLKQYPKVNSDIFNFVPQLHKFRSNSISIKREPNKDLLPITVQTNNIEIPPLGIALDKPQNLINQNIIVTTMIPYRIVANNKVNRDSGSQHFDRSKTSEAYKSNQIHPRLYKDLGFTHAVQPFYSNDKDDVARFRLHSNERSKYNADYYEKTNIEKHKSRLNNEPNHQIVPRFHETLENVERFGVLPEQRYGHKVDCCEGRYAYSKAMVECCNGKIASRQQMSLYDMKRNPYDDTHFKNFLQSQQKVTDMLEKILSDRGNVQSVEIA